MKQLTSFTQVLDRLRDSGHISLAGVSTTSAKAFFLSHFLPLYEKGCLWVCEDPEMIEKMTNDFRIWSDLPSVNISDESRRGEVLAILAGERAGIVFSDVEHFKTITVPSLDVYKGAFVSVVNGEKVSQIELFEHLISIGYEVEEGELTTKGRYHKKGGVVDVFLVNSDHPIRISFFEDQIEEVYSYNILSGKKIEDLDSVVLYPVSMQGEKQVEGIESYLREGLIFLDEVADDFYVKSEHTIRFTPFVNKEYDTEKLDYTSVFRYSTPLDFLVDLKQKLEDKWEVYIFAQDKERVWNFLTDKEFKASELSNVHIFGGGHIETWITSEEMYKTKASNLQRPEAFESKSEKILCLTSKEIFGSEGSGAITENVGNAFLDSLHDGDYVVHIDHGIGIFQGVSRNTFSDVEREYLVLEYAKNDKLYIPIDKAEKVNKYLGVDMPKLTTLGSAEWDTITKKVKEDTDRIAKELLDIYARREIAKGFGFAADNDIQKKFETDFKYDLTPGQAKAVADIKIDMETGRPMDRLVCGDVGFGKTEVAMRAAFKAVQGGKQVAFIAPITILVDQQYKSFQERMQKYGVIVEQLSRFKSAKEQMAILDNLRRGDVDIVVGTHRLLQSDVDFKDLGLVIIDEEQRFGVKQKELMKDMRSNVDMLTLTATPIPRTLNLGLSGLRDISTITTAPPGRLPVHTEIRRFGYPLIRDAIMKEVERGGQVYFLHNRVATIEGVAEKLQSMMPNVRVLVTHGQLTPVELEKRIMAFKRHEYDVLVSSTIIENGIDLPNANTLIVDRAEAFGLAQAYQLRGRVGRSPKQAYAYFLYQAQQLQSDAKKRLKAIMEASDLGSGFQIAMKDLDIRGSGEILGAKQHGAVSTIGISHFSRILNNTVDRLKSSETNQKFEEENADINADLSISCLLPDSYVPEISDKLKWYQRLSSARSESTLRSLRGEMESRYGTLPEQAENLFKLSLLKIVARASLVGSVENFKLEGREVIDIILSGQVTPKAIFNLLEYCPTWVVTGNKLRIDMIELQKAAGKHNLHWVDELIACVKTMKEEDNCEAKEEKE